MMGAAAMWLALGLVGFQGVPDLRGVESLPRAEVGTWGELEGEKPPEGERAAAYKNALGKYRSGSLYGAARVSLAWLETSPDDPPFLLLLGASLYRVQRYGQAVAAFERFLVHQPGQVERTRQLGHCYFSLGRADEARAHFDRVLEVQPGDWKARRSRGVVQLRVGELDGAKKDLSGVLERQPGDGEALYWMALCLYNLEQTEAAKEAVLRAREAAPYDPRVWFLWSQIGFELGENKLAEEARKRYQDLLAVEVAAARLQRKLWIQPRDLGVLEEIAKLRLLAGDLERAGKGYGLLRRVALEDSSTEIAERAQRCLEGIRRVR